MVSIQSTNIYPQLEELFSGFLINNGDSNKKELEKLFAFCTDGMERSSEKLLSTIIIKALNKRICSNVIDENIYEKCYEIPQIQLFNILIEKFPFVKYSQQITNTAIANLIQNEREATIIDIGIGQGTQILNILDLLKHSEKLEKLVVVGIEPFSNALATAQERIMSFSTALSFEVEFIARQEYIEQMDFTSLSKLPGKIVVNASLALHHIQSAEQRLKTIESVKSLNPAAFVLIEPNVNHFEPDLMKRLKQCFHHFYSIFKVIDNLEIEETDKNALKLFFGREIEDILGKQEADRYEKHEKATQWIDRLVKSQFNIPKDVLKLPLESHLGVKMKYHQEGFFGFTYEEETVLAVIYAN